MRLHLHAPLTLPAPDLLPVVLHTMPATRWVKRQVLSEDGHLGPAMPLTDVVFSSDPKGTAKRSFAASAGSFVLDKSVLPG